MRIAIAEDLADIGVILDYMMEVAQHNDLSSSNKFMFDRNDYKKGFKSPMKLLNDQMWKEGNGVVLNSAHFGFYILKDGKDITVYACENNGGHGNIENLIKKIKSYPEQVGKNLAFQSINDKVVFTNDKFVHALYNDIKLNKTALMDKGFGEPTYPVDIKSYEYQLSYWQKKTRIPEFDFVNNVLFGGFMSDYDAEKGRFYIKNTKYDPSVIGFRIKEKEQQKKVTLIDPHKIDFEYLDKDWQNAIGKVLEVLKRDRPAHGEKEDKLDKLIKFYEKKLSSKSAQIKLDF